MRSNSNISEKIISSTQYTNDENYWLNQLSGHLEKSMFPCDFKRTGEYKTRQEHITFTIPGEICAKIIEISKGSTPKIFMVLTAGLITLLDKYTFERNKDIIIGAPIYKQETETQGEFINTVLALKNRAAEHMSFKELLRQVRQTIIDANENANYPIETLLYQLDLSFTADDFPLFDVAILLENIHDRNYLKDIHLNMIFSFFQTGDNIQGTVEYNGLLYEKTTIERIIRHYNQLLKWVLNRPDSLVGRVEILSEEEKQQVLLVFNQTGFKFPGDQTVDRLFAKQAGAIPGNTAVVFEDKHLTYSGLNERAGSLARALRCKGVNRDIIVGIMASRCLEMIIGMLAVLKAGGAYLPIDPDYPEARKRFMLKDSQARLLVTQKELLHQNNNIPVTISKEDIIDLQEENSYAQATCNLPGNHKPDDLIYVIYTSGTTGQPKGVLIGHKGFVNLVYAHQKVFEENPRSRVSQVASISFDAMAFEVWPCLTNGASLYIAVYDIRMDPVRMKEWLITREITISFQSTMMFERLLREEWPGKGLALKVLRTAGDKLNRCPVRQYPFHLYNLYGPTEDTVWSTWTEVTFETDEGKDTTIGKPVGNHQVYIVGTYLHLQPVGVPGELCISGVGLARGYLNRPQLTSEKFIFNSYQLYRSYRSYTAYISKKLYKTGDLARWLADGNIEFLGRFDSQVKIRGYRIELGEVERQLIDHPGIKEAVVIARKMSITSASDRIEDNVVLCAYIVSNRELPAVEIREYLSEGLPDYMIPSYFVQVETIPLTPAGKIDRKALPEPKVSIGENYVAPRNEIEKELVRIWSELLGIPMEKISIHDNFFHLGGHSLKAILLAAKIHEKLNINVPLAEIFRWTSIGQLSDFIKHSVKHKFMSLEAVEKREYYPLSSVQGRMYILQQMDLKSVVYNIPVALKLEGEADKEKLAGIFKKLIQRHESFRTAFLVVDDRPVQRIHDKVKFEVEYDQSLVNCQGRGEVPSPIKVEKITRDFIRPFDLTCAPLVRVGLIKTAAQEHILMMDTHHIISDGISSGIMTKEFMDLQAGKKLPVLRFQYKNYSQWQNRQASGEYLEEQRIYWLKQFEEEVPVLNLPLDYSRPLTQNFEGHTVNFELNKEETAAIKSLAREQDVTLFMLLLSLYNIFLCKLSGQEDIVVGTPIAGRRHADLEGIIGMFVNTLALRNFPVMEKTFHQFLEEIKENTMKAFENHDYLYEDLVEQVEVERDTGRNPLFDVMFALQNIDTLAVQIPGLKIEPYHYESRISKFDLTLTAIEIEDHLAFTFEYSTNLFKEETIQRFTGFFKRTVANIIENYETRISEIEIITEEEKNRILMDFNDTVSEYPRDKTIHQLFAEQVKRTPHRIAVMGPRIQTALKFSNSEHNNISITYSELNGKSNQLAYLLRDKGVKPDTIAGITAQPSVEMIIAIMAVLKAGGAYLPIDPDSPKNRLQYMLKDCNAKLLLAQHHLLKTKPGDIDFNGEIIDITGDNLDKNKGKGSNLKHINSPGDLLYTIYTSGTTGKPKGMLIKHENLVNYISWFTKTVNLTRWDKAVLISSFAFDLGYTAIYSSILQGGELHVIPNETYLSAEGLLGYIKKNKISYIKCTPSLFSIIVGTGAVSLRTCSTLRLVVLGGEAIVPLDVKAAHAACPHLEVMNHYGPTETTIGSIAQFIDFNRFDEYQKIPTIGSPIHNTVVYILDKNMQWTLVGVPGELFIGGNGVGRGYLNQPGLTAEKFDHDLWDYQDYHDEKKANFLITNKKVPGKKIHMSYMSYLSYKLYKSGDLARWLTDGRIEFLGRIDHQIKIRGFRVEIGEIQDQLLGSRLIKEAVVIHRDNSSGGKNLCAYVVPPVPGDKSFNIAGLRDYLCAQLPDYMIPSYFIPIEQIPLTPNGKLDRNALPGPGTAIGPGYAAYMEPANEVEKKLSEIWAETLELEQKYISADANFFELGGHSLKAIMMVTRVHKELNVKVPLAEIFKMPTIKTLAAYIKESAQDTFTAIEPVEQKNYYPLSSTQKRLHAIQQLEPASTVYNTPLLALLEGEVNKKKFEEIFKKLVKRHESLRTSFEPLEGEPVQRIHEEVAFKIEYYDLSSAEEEIEINDMIKNIVAPFDLSRAPLMKTVLLTIGVNKHILMVDIHHTIVDGVSHGIFIKEFMALYEVADMQLPELRLQYKDYACWENSEQMQTLVKEQEIHWLKEFPGELPVLNLPTDQKRPGIQRFEGETASFEIKEEETRKLRRLASEEDATLYMLLLSIFYVFLSKLSDQNDIIVGLPVAGRKHADLQPIMGMFVNTLALRSYPESQKTCRKFLAEIREKTLKAFDNQDYQFEDLVNKLSLKRDTSRNPLFDVMYVLQNLDFPPMEIPGLKLAHYRYENKTSKFDLTLVTVEVEDNLELTLEYSINLFKQDTIERFITYLKKIISVVVENPDIKICDVDFLPEEEKRQLLKDFNDTGADHPRDKLIHQLFAEQVERTPDNIALHGCMIAWMNGEEGSITYKELNEKSNRLAGFLKIKGIDVDTMAVIMMDPCIEMIIGILAVLKCGTCYLPIDPMNPEERIEYLLTESEAKLLLTHPFLTVKAKGGIETLNISDERMYTGEARGGSQSVKPGDSVYMIYTSGSTGKPKGVMIKHENLVNYVNWFSKTAGLNIEDRTPLTSSFSFDLGYTSLYSSLLVGGQLHILPRELYTSPGEILAYIHRHRISYLKMTPSLFGLIAADPGFSIETCRSLRLVVLGGEAINVTDVEKAYHVCPHIKIMNHYGPTEATIGCIAQFIDPDDLSAYRKRPTIGRPIFNTKVFVLDRYLKPLPAGIPGELCISGAGLARGYLNRPELTAEKFDHDLWDYRDYQDKKKNYKLQNTKYKQIPNYKLQITNKEAPFGQILKATTPPLTTHHSPIYHTGDLARWHPDGNIEFQGRIDHQVKIRGFRIELGEIETILNRHEAVKEAAVVLYNQKGNPCLVAYVVPHVPRENHPIENTGIRRFLAKHLPDYMVPSAFVILESLPLAPGGKTDRRKLSTLPPDHSLKSENFVAPRTPGEELLAGIWADALDARRVGIHDNFFELGGHSFTAMQVVSRANQVGLSLTMRQLFQHQTIDELSTLVNFPDTAGSSTWLEEEMQMDGGSLPEIVPISRDRDIPLSFSQQRCRMYQLANPGITYYNVPHWSQIKGKLDINILRQSFNEIIRRHDILRTTFPEKNNTPYQVIMEQQEVEIAVTDLQNLPGPEQTRQLEKRIKEENERPFDLVHGPLMRVTLVKLEEETHVLGLVMHHMIMDIYSVIILAREFSIIYDAFLSGKPCPLPGLTLQYADFASWQHRYYTREILEDRLRYWEQWLAGKPPRLELPGDRPRPRVETYRGGTKRSQYTPDLVREIKKLAKQSGTSFFMTIMAAFMTSLYHYSGYEDLVVAFPILNRNHQVKTVIGMFTATLLLRIDMGGNPSFRELLDRVQRASLSALEKQDVPFEHLVKTLRPGWDLSSKPSYRVLLNTAPYYIEPVPGIPGLLDITPLTRNVGDDNVMRHDLSLNIAQEKISAGTNLYAVWRYKKDLFDAETIDRLADHFRFILEEMVKNPGQGVEDFIKDRSLEYQIKETNHESAANIS